MIRRRLPRIGACFLAAFLSVAAVFPAVTTDGLRAVVFWLADPARDGRNAGSPGAAESAKYIQRQFEQIGYNVAIQEFGGNRRNVVARYGTAARHIVLGAHYDGQGHGMPSASDNAAGIAVILELARDLKQANLPVSLVVVAFDDEEQGMNGSRYYVDHPPFPLDNALAAIVIDAMGRPFVDLKESTLFVLGTEYSTDLAAIVQRRRQPDMLVAGTDLIGARSDFAPFAVKKIPFLFFSHGTHKDYHDSGDTPDRIDYATLATDAGRIGQVIRDIAALTTKPLYAEKPVYPAGEVASLFRLFELVQKEKTTLPRAYSLVFADLRDRVTTDKSREALRMAAAAVLGVATPRLSPFILNFELEPYYLSVNKPDIAKAIAEESRRWGN